MGQRGTDSVNSLDKRNNVDNRYLTDRWSESLASASSKKIVHNEHLLDYRDSVDRFFSFGKLTAHVHENR